MGTEKILLGDSSQRHTWKGVQNDQLKRVRKLNRQIWMYSGNKSGYSMFKGSRVCETCGGLAPLLYKQNIRILLRSKLKAKISIFLGLKVH